MIFAGASLGRSTPITRGARTIELLSSRISTAAMIEKENYLQISRWPLADRRCLPET